MTFRQTHFTLILKMLGNKSIDRIKNCKIICFLLKTGPERSLIIVVDNNMYLT